MSENLVLPKSESPQMFNAIARRYDILNRMLSLGQDIAWRERLKEFLPTTPRLKLLDLATGTADVLISLTANNPNIERGVGVDPAVKMLDIGKEKIIKAGLGEKVSLQVGDAQALVFDDETFDALTISFGIRNVPDLRLGLLEMYRVTKKGGRVIILEFSKPANPVLYAGHWLYMNTVVPLIGFLFSGNLKAYQYLNQTVRDFPFGERFCMILKQFGFINVRQYPLLGGVASIYVADK